MVTRTPTRVWQAPIPAARRQRLRMAMFGVALYHTGRPELAGLGAGLLLAASKLRRGHHLCCLGLLSIALAVHAADRFVVRRELRTPGRA